MRLPDNVRAQVAARLESLEQQPRPRGALAGHFRGLMRLRVGDYRVVYQVDDDARSVTVTRVRHRSKAYR
jgi:mRNA interferase RelE/StbE